MRISQELQEILTTKAGYRNDEYQGSGVADVREVIKFEMYELLNDDILDFFVENYGFDSPFEDYQRELFLNGMWMK